MPTIYKDRLLLSLTILFSSLLLGACSTNKTNSLHSTTRSATSSSPNNIVAVNLKTLQSVDSIARQLTAAKHRAVFVGESHTNYSDHLNQLAIIKALHKRWGKHTSIGLEMVQQPYQSYLDEYIAGRIDEKAMLRGIQWYDRWKYDFRLYRPIFRYAKANKIPMVALNIPKELTKRITKVGIAGLNPQQRQQLPATIDRSNSQYRNRIKSVFGRHATTSSKGFNKFLDAQLGWDEGMAFAAAKYLKQHPEKNMVILAGSGHVTHYEGIPSRLDRLAGIKSAVILNDISGNNLAQSGDYLLFSPAKKLPPVGRFGIGMKDTPANKGILVTLVTRHGAARKAGIKKGDIITALNHHPIRDTLDLRTFAETSKPGDKITITIRRKHQKLDLKAILQGKPPTMGLFRHKR